MPEANIKPWYTTWFDSPYYELLYKERDQQEADLFIKNLITFLKPSPQSFMLDIACGKGRHAIALNKMGFTVTGFDLSEKNIKTAKKFENSTLDFYVHDMRRPFMVNYYDIIFNLFTSFGYFEKERENKAVLENIYNALKPKGLFVLDYANMEKALHCLSQDHEVKKDNIVFRISKSISKEGFLVKQITVEDGGKQLNFEEQIKVFTMAELTKYVETAGFEIVSIFGDYKLGQYNAKESDRLILICKKK